MPRKLIPKFDIRAIKRLDPDPIDDAAAIAVLEAMDAAKADLSGYIQFIKSAVATIQIYEAVESNEPLVSEQNEALRMLNDRLEHLRTAMAQLDTEDRALIDSTLWRYQNEGDFATGVGCIDHVRDNVSVLIRHESKLVQSAWGDLEEPLKHCEEILRRLDDHTEGNLVDGTTLALEHAEISEADADVMTRFDFCLERLSKGIEIAIAFAPKGGPRFTPAAASSVSYLVPAYEELTGKTVSYWGSANDKSKPQFLLFVEAIFDAADLRFPEAAVCRAIKNYCRYRNRSPNQQKNSQS